MPTARVASLHQPNYLPWRGLFAKISASDVFVIFDDVQLPTGGHQYETRAMVGPVQLNIPVHDRGAGHLIKDVRLAEGPWRRKHLASIRMHCPRWYDVLAPFYAADWMFLANFNWALISEIAEHLGIQTQIVRSSTLGVPGQGTEKILGILKAVGATEYISGTGAGSLRYVDEETFARAGIKLRWHTYQGPNVSVICEIPPGGKLTL